VSCTLQACLQSKDNAIYYGLYREGNEQSNTKKLLDAFIEEISISDVEELDLLDDVPDMLLDNNLLAHINRNMLGQKLLPDEEKLLL
jgi:hypothetical protein